MIRIYGPTQDGQSCTLHVHGVLPYFFVQVPAVALSDIDTYATQLRAQIDAKMLLAYQKGPGARGTTQFAAKIEPCRARPFYGYTREWRAYLKISFFSPAYVNRCATLFASGGITGYPVQTYESHIPYMLAFLTDYNLYGCNWIEFSRYSRRPANGEPLNALTALEMDTAASNIVNRANCDRESLPLSSMPAPKVTSLRELREKNESLRTALGVAFYTNSLSSAFTTQRRSVDDTWEFADEYSELWKQRRDENMLDEPAVQHNVGDLPTPADLLPAGAEELTQETREGFVLYPKTEHPKTERRCQTEHRCQTQHRSAGSEPSQVQAPGSKRPSQHQTPSSQGPPKKQHRSGGLSEGSTSPQPSSGGLSEAPKKQHGSGGLSEAPKKQHRSGGLSEAPKKQPSSGGLSEPSTQSSAWSFSSSDLTQHFETNMGYPAARESPRSSAVVYRLRNTAPEPSKLEASPGFVHPVKPFYSKPGDIPVPPFSYGGVVFDHPRSTKDLPQFEFSRKPNTIATKDTRHNPKRVWWELASRPPTRSALDSSVRPLSQTEANSTAQAFTLPTISPSNTKDEMSVLVAEVFVASRPGFVPIASTDPIIAVFWRFSAGDLSQSKDARGIISTEPTGTDAHRQSAKECIHELVDSEAELFSSLLDLLVKLDPDIICGYETTTMSWGYISARYQQHYNTKIDLGRVKDGNTMRELPFNVEIACRGRHLLNLWNLLRKEVTLLKYTLEFAVLHVFHETTPYLDSHDLSALWRSCETAADIKLLGTSTSISSGGRQAVEQYIFRRIDYVLRLLDNLEIITKYCAHSRVIGIDFMSSITRGSQFQVEAVMARLSKREHYVLISPSRKQVGQQNALEHIPLVMEPKSAFYSDPVCVLDFRSLYPSIIIAYNLCYSTFVSRLRSWRGKNRMGFLDELRHPQGLLNELENDIYVAPNGMAYVTENIRKSLIAQMLSEILECRFMLKDSLKLRSNDARYQRNMQNQQKALKFIANVTYGYTSASFSGRMPCSELADSVVLTGRELLMRAVKQINECRKWDNVRPETVYGDTDSLFVKLPRVTVQQAWAIGAEIADMVTAANRSPIVLELEKVYDGCFLVTKKRYVGNASMSPDSQGTKLDARGIETIRRDGTPIEQKIEKGALEIFFRHRDLSLLKTYLTRQWAKILSGKVLLQDFCFAREVRLGFYSENASTAQLPGGAIVSLQRLARDPGAEPQYRERVPFIVAAGPPGSRIADRCHSPREAMDNPDSIMVDVDYYISKNIVPPLERLFNLAGANVKAWFHDMPKSIRYNHMAPQGADNLRTFLRYQTCSVCLERCELPVCSQCQSTPARSVFVLEGRRRLLEASNNSIRQTCRRCTGPELAAHCRSLDCSRYYRRQQASVELSSQTVLGQQALEFLDGCSIQAAEASELRRRFWGSRS